MVYFQTYSVVVGVGGSNPGGTDYDGIDGGSSSLASIVGCGGGKGFGSAIDVITFTSFNGTDVLCVGSKNFS